MKSCFVLPMLAAAALSLASAAAEAQTANSSPTAPAGAAGSASTVGPSTGELAPKTGAPKIGAPTATERKEEKKSDQDMSICKGC